LGLLPHPVAQLSAPVAGCAVCRDTSLDALPTGSRTSSGDLKLGPVLEAKSRTVAVWAAVRNCGTGSGGAGTLEPMLVQPLSCFVVAGGEVVRPKIESACVSSATHSGAVEADGSSQGGGATPPRPLEVAAGDGGVTAVAAAAGGSA
jgi:hypothetical protein